MELISATGTENYRRNLNTLIVAGCPPETETAIVFMENLRAGASRTIRISSTPPDNEVDVSWHVTYHFHAAWYR
ncbi:hypothetical protein Plhal304r1_c046g0128161 [Plasmopara halstedii]